MHNVNITFLRDFRRGLTDCAESSHFDDRKSFIRYIPQRHFDRVQIRPIRLRCRKVVRGLPGSCLQKLWNVFVHALTSTHLTFCQLLFDNRLSGSM